MCKLTFWIESVSWGLECLYTCFCLTICQGIMLTKHKHIARNTQTSSAMKYDYATVVVDSHAAPQTDQARTILVLWTILRAVCLVTSVVCTSLVAIGSCRAIDWFLSTQCWFIGKIIKKGNVKVTRESFSWMHCVYFFRKLQNTVKVFSQECWIHPHSCMNHFSDSPVFGGWKIIQTYFFEGNPFSK